MFLSKISFSSFHVSSFLRRVSCIHSHREDPILCRTAFSYIYSFASFLEVSIPYSYLLQIYLKFSVVCYRERNLCIFFIMRFQGISHMLTTIHSLFLQLKVSPSFLISYIKCSLTFP